jgi:hypothetical protein
MRDGVLACDWLSGWAFQTFSENSAQQRLFLNSANSQAKGIPSFGDQGSVSMASSSPPPEVAVKKDSISFAPPPPELQFTRQSQDILANDQQPREHPDSSHQRSSLADAPGSTRSRRAMSSPPPPPAYTPRGGPFQGFID